MQVYFHYLKLQITCRPGIGLQEPNSNIYILKYNTRKKCYSLKFPDELKHAKIIRIY